MKTVSQKTFDKQVREGRVEVCYEVSENDEYRLLEVRGRNGNRYLKVNKTK